MHPVGIFELIVAMALAVLVLHYLAQDLELPPAVALLVGGGALAFAPGLPTVEIDPELVLVIFLPPLLMDGAWFTALAPFRRHLGGIASLAIGAVLFTAAAVAIAVKLVVPGLPWSAAIALGAIVSPPDAVSARAVLQRVKLPRRLGTLLEGESLVNDAAARTGRRSGRWSEEDGLPARAVRARTDRKAKPARLADGHHRPPLLSDYRNESGQRCNLNSRVFQRNRRVLAASRRSTPWSASRRSGT